MLIGGCIASTAMAQWHYQAELGAGWRQIVEREEGEKLVEEQGAVAEIATSVALSAGGWRLSATGAYSGGKLDYTGVTQLGAPLETETDWEGWQVGTGVERRFLGALPASIGVGISYENRWRGIASESGVQGLDERYRTVWLDLNGALQPLNAMRVSASFGCAVHSEVRVSFSAGFDSSEVALEDHCRGTVASDIRLGRLGAQQLYLRPFVDWERYPESDTTRLTVDGAAVGVLYLPETELVTVGVTLGLRGSGSRGD